MAFYNAAIIYIIFFIVEGKNISDNYVKNGKSNLLHYPNIINVPNWWLSDFIVRELRLCWNIFFL